MQTYLDFLQYIKQHGNLREDRTGVGTHSVFGYQMRFDLQKGFPLVTTKAIHLPSLVHELLWFLQGESNVGYLQQKGVKIWDAWADASGDLGPIYGKQWRAWETKEGQVIDQIETVIQHIRHHPHSRRLIVSAWNVGELHEMALPPCHLLFQFYVHAGRLSCQLTQRSADGFLGVPFNIASYALLVHLVAQQCDLDVGEFIWSGGDCHLYINHMEQVNIQLSRMPYPLPHLRIRRKPPSISHYRYEDFIFENYLYHPKLPAPIAV